MPSEIHEFHQQVILARLRSFCDYAVKLAKDEPEYWNDMVSKLYEVGDHVSQLKQEQLLEAKNKFIKLLKNGAAGDEDITDFKTILDPYLPIGDYADIVFHLIPANLAVPAKRDFAVKSMEHLKAASLLAEEKLPEEQRASRSKKLTSEIYQRLGFDLCEKVLAHRKTHANRRTRLVLYRVGRRVAEYCAVLHFPDSPSDTFSPFLLTRIEALIVCCLRLLAKFPS